MTMPPVYKMTVAELEALDHRDVYTAIKNGEWNMHEFTSWVNALRHVTFAEGYNEMKERSPDKVELSNWIEDPDAPHCWMRVFKDSNPAELKNRVAYIEKTPRVRVMPFVSYDGDHKNWLFGPKGTAPEYGLLPASRKWCDEQLVQMGYKISNA